MLRDPRGTGSAPRTHRLCPPTRVVKVAFKRSHDICKLSRARTLRAEVRIFLLQLGVRIGNFITQLAQLSQRGGVAVTPAGAGAGAGALATALCLVITALSRHTPLIVVIAGVRLARSATFMAAFVGLAAAALLLPRADLKSHRPLRPLR